jgi:hypothetical protein
VARAGKGQQGRARVAVGVQVTRGGGWKQEVVRQQLLSGGRGVYCEGGRGSRGAECARGRRREKRGPRDVFAIFKNLWDPSVK